eukprot:7086724-Alexandrium_andersonii.AAC.1
MCIRDRSKRFNKVPPGPATPFRNVVCFPRGRSLQSGSGGCPTTRVQTSSPCLLYTSPSPRD